MNRDPLELANDLRDIYQIRRGDQALFISSARISEKNGAFASRDMNNRARNSE